MRDINTLQKTKKIPNPVTFPKVARVSVTQRIQAFTTYKGYPSTISITTACLLQSMGFGTGNSLSCKAWKGTTQCKIKI